MVLRPTNGDKNVPRHREFFFPSDQQGRWPCQTGKELAGLQCQIWPKLRFQDFLCYQSFGCQFFGSRDCEGAVTTWPAMLFN
jgi:hypothetical protein